jgi:hypothetical protein
MVFDMLLAKVFDMTLDMVFDMLFNMTPDMPFDKKIPDLTWYLTWILK